MIVHRARWVLPIAGPPVRAGWVAVARGRIVAVGGPGDEPPSGLVNASAEPDAPSCEAILPGLVNAHTHLELSWLRGRVPPAPSMSEWASQMMALRRQAGSDAVEPIADAIREARAAGTSLVGDISNSLAAYEPLAESDLSGIVFRELLGFNAPNPGALVAQARRDLAALTPLPRLRTTVTPHAPFSVSPDLFRAIAAASEGLPVSLHLGESAEEVQFLRDGTGSWREVLERVGAWNAAWAPPGCGPVEYIDALGVLGPRLLAVHCVQLSDAALDRLAEAGATVITCPRSNRWTGAGTAPVERFYRAGVRVAVGTDSLASVESLNIFAELAAARAIAPGVGASRLLRAATLDGAAALGFEADLGSLEKGKRAELIAVRVPADPADVEEYLVGGVQPQDIRWLDAG